MSRKPLTIRIEQLRLKTPNQRRPNSRGEALAMARQIRAILERCYWAFVAAQLSKKDMPLRAVATRIAPRRLDDDNLIGAFKAPLDALAHALGVDDKNFVIIDDRPGMRIGFAQRSEGVGRYAIIFELFYE